MLCCGKMSRYSLHLPFQALVPHCSQQCVYLLSWGEVHEADPLTQQGALPHDGDKIPGNGPPNPSKRSWRHELVELRFHSDGRLEAAEIHNAFVCGLAAAAPPPSATLAAAGGYQGSGIDSCLERAEFVPRVRWTWVMQGIFAWTCEDGAVRFFLSRRRRLLLLHLVAEAGPLLRGDTAHSLSVVKGETCLCGADLCTCNSEIELLVGCSTGRIISVSQERLSRLITVP